MPELLTPGDGPLLPYNGAFFEWSDVPGAARYQLTLINPDGGKVDVNTVSTAHAPSDLTSGNWTWSVAAFDAADKPLGSSQSRGFRIDSIPPKVLKVKPGNPKAKSDLKVLFSERIKGISKKTVKLKKANAKGKFKVVKAKVKVKRAGKLAVINPKGRLKKGTYVIVFKNTVIKDLAGNPLVDKKIRAPSP